MRRVLTCLLLLAAPPALAGSVDDARQVEASGDLEAAVGSWRRAVEAQPDDAEAYEGLGRVLLKAGRAGEAVEAFRLFIARVPTYQRGSYRLAFALRKEGRYAQAAEAYRAAIERAPDDPDARFGLAETLRQLGDQDGAIQAYRDYLRLESRPSEAPWVERARQAIRDLEASATVEPEAERPLEPAPAAPTPAAPSSTPAANDPDARFAAGDYAGARRGYEAMLLRSPDAAPVAYRAAVASAVAGDAAAAETHAGRAATLDPGNPAATDLALLAHARRVGAKAPPPTLDEVELALSEGRARTAERLAAAAIAATTDDRARARLSWARGRALLALGRGADALAALKAAAGQGVTDPALWVWLGEAAALAGDPEAARYYDTLAARALPERHPLAARVRARVDSAGTRP